MLRIYTEYAKSLFMEYADYFMLGMFMVTSFMLVSIRDVFSNVPKNDIISAFRFFLVALRDTSWVIQAFIAGFFARTIIAGAKIVYKNFGNKLPLVAKFKY